MVDLAVVPHEASHLVVVGTSLRKPANILSAYLKSLAWQVPLRNVQFFYVFIDDGLEPDARALIDQFVVDRGGLVWPSVSPPVDDFSDVHPVTHQWSDNAMRRVGANKDRILEFARVNRAEGVWLCDGDLVCDPMTFTSIWSVPSPIVCAVYWTKWQKTPSEQNPVHAGPQVWMVHPYGLSGGGLEEWELRQKLIDRELVRIYGQGACTLIRREALTSGVCFAPLPDNVGAGLMQGEDRQFSIRAERLHLTMTADGWSDIWHCYHRPEDEALIPEMLQRLERRVYPDQHFDKGDFTQLDGRKHATLGDLISLELCALEPVPTHQGQMYPPPQLVRGRLGKLALHPELEQAVLEMERGEQRIVPVHFPLSWPFPPHRGQRKLIRLTLIDHKSFGFAPVIDTEIIQNDAGGWLDTTQQTPANIELLREIHAA